MDENEGDQFHRNEAISAVVEEGFLGEEDDDYEDLYNDVNVGENFFQSMHKNENVGVSDREAEKKLELTQPVAESSASIPGVVEMKFEGEIEGGDGGSKVSGRVEEIQNLGNRGDEMAAREVNGGSLPPGGSGMRINLAQQLGKVAELKEQTVNYSDNNITSSLQSQGTGQQHQAAGIVTGGNLGNAGNGGFARVGGNINGTGTGTAVGAGTGSGGGSTILFVGDLHWWTTDAEVEAELCKYGAVKELRFFDEKASGKSKGYCQVDFYDPAAATSCKEGMNGHVFNGRPCVVAFASPYSVKRMGEAQVNRNQQAGQANLGQARRGGGDAPLGKPIGSNVAPGGNYQGGGDNNRGYGRGNWGRGNPQGMGNRGPTGPIRNRPGGMIGRGIMGNGGNGFGQGIGAGPPLLPPQGMMGQGFDPAFGAPMGRMGGYGGFPGAPTPPFSGMMNSFAPVGGVGLPGVAPHLNPAFFGRGMPMNGMGMMPHSGVEGHNMGMWSDPNMAGWGGEEHGGRVAESSYAEEAVSDHQYGEESRERAGRPNAMKEKDRGSEREWSGSSDRRYRDEREPDYDRELPRDKEMSHDHEWSERRRREDRDISRDREKERERNRDREHSRERSRDRDRDRDRHRDERDRYVDHHRYRDREPEYDDEWERGRSSRTHSKSRLAQEEELRLRSRDAEYAKRRRLTSE